jgi:hypothetical protein
MPETNLQRKLLSERQKDPSKALPPFKKYKELGEKYPNLPAEEKCVLPNEKPFNVTTEDPDMGPLLEPPTELTTAAS